MRGAWIEIWEHVPRIYAESGRSPCGERGLKYAPAPARRVADWSLPVRGAWIEMRSPRSRKTATNVAPRAGSVD